MRHGSSSGLFSAASLASWTLVFFVGASVGLCSNRTAVRRRFPSTTSYFRPSFLDGMTTKGSPTKKPCSPIEFINSMMLALSSIQRKASGSLTPVSCVGKRGLWGSNSKSSTGSILIGCGPAIGFGFAVFLAGMRLRENSSQAICDYGFASVAQCRLPVSSPALARARCGCRFPSRGVCRGCGHICSA